MICIFFCFSIFISISRIQRCLLFLVVCIFTCSLRKFRIEFDRAFADSKVKSVVFPPDSKLRIIGDEAFEGCALETINIPSSVVFIRVRAFAKSNVKSVEFSSNSKLRKIRKQALNNPLWTIFIHHLLTRFENLSSMIVVNWCLFLLDLIQSSRK